MGRSRQGVLTSWCKSWERDREGRTDRKSSQTKVVLRLKGGSEPTCPWEEALTGPTPGPSTVLVVTGWVQWSNVASDSGSSCRLSVTHILHSSLFWRQSLVGNHVYGPISSLYRWGKWSPIPWSQSGWEITLIYLPGQQRTWALLTLELNSPAKWGTWASDLMFLTFHCLPKEMLFKGTYLGKLVNNTSCRAKIQYSDYRHPNCIMNI